MQMRKEFLEFGEYEFFPDTYLIPQEWTEFKRQFHLYQSKALENYQGEVTKDVTILINESGIQSSKTKQADEKGITIIENIKSFIEEI